MVKEKIICLRRQMERVCTMKKNNTTTLPIPDDALVTVTTAGDYKKVTYSEHQNTVARTKKLSKDLYCDNYGIVHKYKHTKTRQESIKSVRKSLNELCDVIHANTVYLERCKWVTLTYAENMTDLDRLAKDWGNFRKKALRKWGRFEYIWVKEPQARGAWHLHVIMIFDDKAPYISCDDLYKVWGKGFVRVKNMTSGVDFGLYFTASLRDMPLDEAEKAGIEIDPQKLSKDKKYVKGARLELYPSGIHIFDSSNGADKPVSQKMTYAQSKEEVTGMEEVSQYSTSLLNSEGRCFNRLSITRYKKE